MSKKQTLSLLQWLAIVFVLGVILAVAANYLR
ncbi:hypothetical protein V757_01690 [Pelistega indica]|uniref:Uncharacterized protein n=1 Tax=Pelistega indica TaxID=1414851 RepID=V8GA93_9BURK|nr:hypothetical protein V757_01690 [Pelistega indica]